MPFAFVVIATLTPALFYAVALSAWHHARPPSNYWEKRIHGVDWFLWFYASLFSGVTVLIVLDIMFMLD